MDLKDPTKSSFIMAHKTENSAQIDALNDLLTRNYDAEKGYKEAAENVNSTSLKQTFSELSQQRYNFGHELKNELSKLGGTPEKGSSVAAGAHRTWMDLRAALASNEESAVLDECIRGEEKATDTYRDTLNDIAFSTDTRMVVNRQYETIQRTLADLKRLKETYKTTS